MKCEFCCKLVVNGSTLSKNLQTSAIVSYATPTLMLYSYRDSSTYHSREECLVSSA